MIIYIDTQGNTTHIVPEQLFQYSHNQVVFRVVGDLPKETTFACSFRLPSGETSPQKSMTFEVFEGRHSWVVPITNDITQDYGQMKFQFRGTLDNRTVATGRGIINIFRSDL